MTTVTSTGTPVFTAGIPDSFQINQSFSYAAC
jgi:hypothetical protein